MPLISGADAPQFTLPHATFTGLASPSRGSTESCVWRVTLAPNSDGAAHTLTAEEIFVAIAGAAVITIDGTEHLVRAGDALIVPPHTLLALANPHSEPFDAVCVFPVGGKAQIPGGTPITPPWAE